MSNKNEVFEYLIGQLRQQVNGNQCEDLAHEVQSLKNQLRDMSELVDELLWTITLMNGKSSRRKEDTQYNAWRPHYATLCFGSSPLRYRINTIVPSGNKYRVMRWRQWAPRPRYYWIRGERLSLKHQ